MSTRELIIRRAVSTGTMGLLPLGTGYRPAIIDHVAASLLVVYSPSFIVCRLRRGCPTSLCSSRFVAGARKGLHACRSVRLALVVVKIGALYKLQAYRSPSAGHHEVVICLPTVCSALEREASSENYGPRVYLYHILKSKNTLLQFIYFYFILQFTFYLSLSELILANNH